jgi:hypothetical protein
MYYAVEAVRSPNGTELARLRSDKGYDILIELRTMKKYWVPIEFNLNNNPGWDYISPKDWSILLRKLITLVWRIRSTIVIDHVATKEQFDKDLLQ